MTESDKIQEDLDDEVHCWSQVPRAGSVTTINVSLKVLEKTKPMRNWNCFHSKGSHENKLQIETAEDFKSCCRVLLMPQGLVRQMYPVQSTVVFHLMHSAF